MKDKNKHHTSLLAPSSVLLFRTHSPQVQLGASAATGIDRKVVLLAELLEETEGVALTAMGSLKLLQQEEHCIMDQTQHVGTGHPVEGQRSQPGNRSSLLHPVYHRFPGL